MDHNTLVNNCHSKVALTLKLSSQTTLTWWDPIGVEVATNLEGKICKYNTNV
jgi:hypothetical protein